MVGSQVPSWQALPSSQVAAGSWQEPLAHFPAEHVFSSMSQSVPSDTFEVSHSGAPATDTH